MDNRQLKMQSDSLVQRMDQKHMPSRLICIWLFVGSSVVFANASQCAFINLDDPQYVTENPNVLGGLTWSNVSWAFTDSYKGPGYWVPLTWLSLQADSSLFGADSAWGFHLTNLLMHSINVALIFQILYRTTTRLWLSAFAAAVFAIHPMRVESVVWVTERKDMLSMLFLLLTVTAYCHYALRPSRTRYSAVLLCYVLALMSKPSSVTLPFALMLLDYWPLYRLRLGQLLPAQHIGAPRVRFSWLVLEKIPLLTVAAVISLLTIFLARGTGVLAEHIPWSQRPIIALSGYFGYLEKSFWPAQLAVLYPLGSFTMRRALLALVPLVLITAAAILWRRQMPFFLVGWLWFVGTLFPVSGVLQAGPQAFADRYSYVPHIGLAIAVVWSIGSLRWWQAVPNRVRWGLSVGLLLILGVLTWRQTALWMNTETLFTHTLRVTEGNALSHYALAIDLHRRGKLDEAENHYSAAVAIAPFKTDVQKRYGYFLLGRGKFEKALGPLTVAARAAPNNPQLQYWLGTALTGAGKDDEARSHLQQAFAWWEREDHPTVETSEEQATARFLLGKIELRAGNAAAAIQEFDRALHLQPRYAAAYEWRGVALGRLGRWADAETTLLQGLALNPESPSGLGYWAYSMSRQSKNDFAEQQFAALSARFPEWSSDSNAQAIQLLTSSKFRDVARARELAEQICAATNSKDAVFLDTLAAAYAAEGNFDHATATANAALAIARDNRLIRQIEEHLRYYKKRQALPFVD